MTTQLYSTHTVKDIIPPHVLFVFITIRTLTRSGVFSLLVNYVYGMRNPTNVLWNRVLMSIYEPFMRLVYRCLKETYLTKPGSKNNLHSLCHMNYKPFFVNIEGGFRYKSYARVVSRKYCLSILQAIYQHLSW